MSDSPVSEQLLRTPLYDLHLELGAKMVAFAGYELPIQYPLGVLKEHLHCRQHAGLFDVSHMGQLTLVAKSGGVEAAKLALERLVPADLLAVKLGQQRYSQFTNEHGGTIDDLMISNLPLTAAITAHGGAGEAGSAAGSDAAIDGLFLVVNGACKAADTAHLEKYLAADCIITPLPHRALLALQGPAAAAVLAAQNRDVAAMAFMSIMQCKIGTIDCVISRSGYTGEDGFEISVAAADAVAIARLLLRDSRVLPIGLGARDSLRLEAGLCLYGNDLNSEISPVEAGLNWSIQKSRRSGGARSGGFLGAARLLAELDQGAKRLRVGLKPLGKAPIRPPSALFAQLEGGAPIGQVTSGGFAPSLNAPVAMGLVDRSMAALDTKLYAEVRGQRLELSVVPLPFVPNNFYRG